MKIKLTLLVLSCLAYNFSSAQSKLVQEAHYKNSPIVQMTLNDKKVWVLMDTGATISILNLDSNNEFGFNTTLNLNSQLKVPGFGSVNNRLYQVSNARIKFGKTHLKKRFYAFDITNIVNSIKARTGKKITAIIGTNIMQPYGFVIDMGNETVVMNYYEKKKRNKSVKPFYMVSELEVSAKGH